MTLVLVWSQSGWTSMKLPLCDGHKTQKRSRTHYISYFHYLVSLTVMILESSLKNSTDFWHLFLCFFQLAFNRMKNFSVWDLILYLYSVLSDENDILCLCAAAAADYLTAGWEISTAWFVLMKRFVYVYAMFGRLWCGWGGDVGEEASGFLSQWRVRVWGGGQPYQKGTEARRHYIST